MVSILQAIDEFLKTPAGFIICTVFTILFVSLMLTVFDEWGDSDWAQKEWERISRRDK